jgi:TonB family protein
MRLVVLLLLACVSRAAAQSTEQPAGQTSNSFTSGVCAHDPSIIPDLESVVSAPDTMPRLIGPQPHMPRFALQDGYRGRVVVATVVDTSGRAERGTVTIVESTDPRLSEWACDFAQQLRFVPATVGKRRVRAQGVIPYSFSATVHRRAP